MRLLSLWEKADCQVRILPTPLPSGSRSSVSGTHVLPSAEGLDSCVLLVFTRDKLASPVDLRASSQAGKVLC